MFPGSRDLVLAALLASGWCIGPAAAGDLAAAKRYADLLNPANCELIALQVRGRSLDPLSAEYRAQSDEFYRRARRAEQELATEAKRYQELEAGLTSEERAEARRYSTALAEECVKKIREGMTGKAGPERGGPEFVVPEARKLEASPATR
jgi:hypothetical protein